MFIKKKEGRLGIKNIERFNKALLVKWQWRLLNGEKGLWVKVLKARYGFLEVNPLEVEANFLGLKVSFGGMIFQVVGKFVPKLHLWTGLGMGYLGR